MSISRLVKDLYYRFVHLPHRCLSSSRFARARKNQPCHSPSSYFAFKLLLPVTETQCTFPLVSLPIHPKTASTTRNMTCIRESLNLKSFDWCLDSGGYDNYQQLEMTFICLSLFLLSFKSWVFGCCYYVFHVPLSVSLVLAHSYYSLHYFMV